MICDRIDNSALYGAISPGLARAFEALRSGELANAPEGRHDLDGDRVFALVQRYTTRPPEQCVFESHRQHIDVQAILAGEEAIRHSAAGALEIRQPYEAAKDCALYNPNAATTSLRLRAGEFAVFFPDDAHMPCGQADGPSPVHKVVIKVKVVSGE